MHALHLLRSLVLSLLFATVTMGFVGCDESSTETGSIQGTLSTYDENEEPTGHAVELHTGVEGQDGPGGELIAQQEVGPDGAFLFEDVPAGPVVVSAGGPTQYVVDYKQVTVVAGETITVDLVLQHYTSMFVEPVIRSVVITPAELIPGGTATVVVEADSNDAGNLSYTYAADNGFVVEPGEAGTATLTAPDVEHAVGTLSVTVESDESHIPLTETVEVTTGVAP